MLLILKLEEKEEDLLEKSTDKNEQVMQEWDLIDHQSEKNEVLFLVLEIM
jgi:hypothetical protein